MSGPNVCVIGAGISGLTAGKMLSDYGIPYTCFEAGDRVGGNWAFKNPNGRSSAYASLHIDTSKQGLRFRDFPISDDFPDYPHHSQIKEYLDGYTDAFDLLTRIRFNTPVERCEHLDGGGWSVQAGGEEHRFDVLVVGNGHHWDPRYPDFPGEFSGPTIHSHHYIDPSDPLPLRDKQVLVVGIGNSASDIVSELSLKSNAARVFISTRSGAWVVPKYVAGKPLDEVLGTIPWLPLGPQRFVARLVPRLLSGDPRNYGLPLPDHHFLETHPTVSSELLLRLGSGDAVAKPNVERLDGERVHFVDGTVEDVDAIIYATGYNISFPFFDPGFISAPENRIRLYKRMFKPGFDDLVFIGFAQAIPTAFPFVELQSQLLARYLAGTYRPPSVDEMERVIDADHRAFAGKFKDVPRNTQELDWPSFEREMRVREIPAGRARVAALGPVPLSGRLASPTAAAGS
jgi:cation diffusion facilitator CzcD-associated flavoprotein CzcO